MKHKEMSKFICLLFILFKSKVYNAAEVINVGLTLDLKAQTSDIITVAFYSEESNFATCSLPSLRKIHAGMKANWAHDQLNSCSDFFKKSDLSQKTVQAVIQSNSNGSKMALEIMLVDHTTYYGIIENFSQYSNNKTDLTLLPPCECGIENEPLRARIVGGTETQVNGFPWHVGLRLKNRLKPHCGGTLISYTFVLTAAHCFFNPKNGTQFLFARNMEVVVGDHDIFDDSESIYTKVIDVEAIIIHPLYTIQRQEHDLTLVVLSSIEGLLLRTHFNQGVRPACIFGNSEPQPSEVVTALGWGKVYSKGPTSNVLRRVNLQIQDREECHSKYKHYGVEITKNMICAHTSGKDTCSGDSGGPLLKYMYGRVTLVGITSFGIGCASKSHAGVYTNVASYYNWINQFPHCATDDVK